MSYIEGTIDINTLIRDQVVHEFLHLYLNNAVYGQNELIEELASQKDIKEYVGELYWNMPWHRAVDENIVRAVETRVYAQFYNNEDNAYREIIQKEIEIGGFTYVDRVYQSLENYENNRDIYNDLDLYIPAMIKELFTE